jgi:hypothetical protein
MENRKSMLFVSGFVVDLLLLSDSKRAGSYKKFTIRIVSIFMPNKLIMDSDVPCLSVLLLRCWTAMK